jgi:hypothetical protein
LKPELSDRLIALLARPNSVPVVAAASEALILGWPEHEIWGDLEGKLYGSASTVLRLIAIQRRIRTGRQDQDDKKELLWLASIRRWPQWRRSAQTPTLIVEGWPADVEIRNLAIRCINPRVRYDDGLLPEAAVRILIADTLKIKLPSPRSAS